MPNYVIFPSCSDEVLIPIWNLLQIEVDTLFTNITCLPVEIMTNVNIWASNSEKHFGHYPWCIGFGESCLGSESLVQSRGTCHHLFRIHGGILCSWNSRVSRLTILTSSPMSRGKILSLKWFIGMIMLYVRSFGFFMYNSMAWCSLLLLYLSSQVVLLQGARCSW